MGNVSPTVDCMEKEAFLTHTSYLNNGHYKVTIDNFKNKNIMMLELIETLNLLNIMFFFI